MAFFERVGEWWRQALLGNEPLMDPVDFWVFVDLREVGEVEAWERRRSFRLIRSEDERGGDDAS